MSSRRTPGPDGPPAARGSARPLVTVAAEHGAGGDVVAPRVAEALGVPFLDRALPADPEEPGQRPGGIVDSLARASTMLASAPLERLDVAEGEARAELTEFLTRAAATGGVVLGHGGVAAVPAAPNVLHVLLAGPPAERAARIAGREGIGQEEAERRVAARDRARRQHVRRAYGIDPDDRRLYHLIVDTVALGMDVAAALVTDATRARIEALQPKG